MGDYDDNPLRELTEALYGDLKRLARSQRGRVASGQTLQTTALVNEAYLKLVRRGAWASREHFMNSAARAMRHILVDHARGRLTAKRGMGMPTDSLDDESCYEDALILRGEPAERVLALDAALERLAALSPRLVSVVECRYFAGYSEEETAALLGLTDRTVRRDWVKAKAWLFREIGDSD
ncbi:MAG: ECF-type sigma factor [Sinimarinibacterium sp.]|jgi:RNA polymerase sigma factor (TIGR02999 family)